MLIFGFFREGKSLKPSLKGNLMLMTTALIWGLSFVAQRLGAQAMGAFGFNGVRFALGGLSLVPLALFMNRGRSMAEMIKSVRRAAPGAMMMGSVLFVAAWLQQYGMIFTTAGNAAFITGLYIILVPFLSLFIRQRVEGKAWFAGIVAVAGLYLMTVQEGVAINPGDVYELGGSFFWAAHILMVDHFVKKHEALFLSMIQFFTCAILSGVAALLFENNTPQMILSAWAPILYGGIMSVGIAYTLQVFGQQYVKPSLAAIILSFEVVLAALAGAWLLSETFSVRGYIGASLIFAGIILSQVQLPGKSKAEKAA